MQFLLLNVVVAVLLCQTLFSVSLHAGSATFNFNDNQLPSADILRGGSGIIANGRLELTPANYYQSASFIIHDLDPGARVTSFSATFNVQIGPGTAPPADGVSFAFGPLATLEQAFAEDGLALPNVRGLSVTFDTFDNGNDFTGIEVFYGSTSVFRSDGQSGRPLIKTNELVTGTFVPVTVTFDSVTGLSMTRGGVPIFSNLDLNGPAPGVGSFENGDQFGFGARTGGYHAVHYVDNIVVSTSAIPFAAARRIDVTRPGDPIAIIGGGATPLNEEVDKAIDNRDGSKYLNVNGAGTGLRVTPVMGATIVTGLSLVSANDEPQRDPTSFVLRGSNDQSNFQVIASGPIPGFANRFQQRIIDIPNSRAFTTYELTFPTVNGGPLVQVAEIALLGAPSPGITPSFAGIGFLGTSEDSDAVGISYDGSVVVGTSGGQAYRWTRGAGIQGLGFLPDGGTRSTAYGVSGDGTVVVGQANTRYASFPNDLAQLVPFRWTATNGMTRPLSLPDENRQPFASVATATSADGTITVGYSAAKPQFALFNTRAFRNNAFLPFLWPDAKFAAAYAVSSDGSVIAGECDSAMGREACLWRASGGPVGLGSIPSAAFGVDPSGTFVVGQSTQRSLTPRAVQWTVTDGVVTPVEMGGLDGVDTQSSAYGVSGDGTLVVGYADSQATLWVPGKTGRKLKELLTSAGLNLNGWNLIVAKAISSDGNTFAGMGTNPAGKFEAWIAVLPTPPVIISKTTVNIPEGSVFEYQITGTRNPTSYGASNLPPGLQFNSTTGRITGTPLEAGVFTATISATNATGTGDVNLMFTIGTPVITSALTSSGDQELPFSYHVTASRNATSFGASGLPLGLQFDPGTGMISGTPREFGQFPVSITATNAVGTTQAVLALTIGPPALGFTSDTAASGRQGQFFNYQITALRVRSDNPDLFEIPTSYGATGLPDGLGIDPTSGLISGTPTANGLFTVVITATNSLGTGNYVLTLAIAPATSTVDPDNLENTYGHGLVVTQIVGSSDWLSSSFSATLTIHNPSTTNSFAGFVNVTYRGFPVTHINAPDSLNFAEITPGGDATVDVSGFTGIGGPTPKAGSVFALVYERNGPATIFQTSALVAKFFDFNTGPPSGGTDAPDSGVTAPGLAPLRLSEVSIHGHASVDERSHEMFTARALMSDGTTLERPAQWTTTRGTITPAGGVLTAGPVSADSSAKITATVTIAGVTKTGSKSITIKDLTPRVTITATDPLALEEAQTDTGKFVVRRNGSTAAALTVTYGIDSGGTAGPGDFEPLTGEVRIPPGQATADIEVRAVDDNEVEGDETVILTITGESDATYEALAPSSATVTIREQRPEVFNEWRSRVFAPSELSIPQISGAAADIDGDGISTLMEFGLNLDPKVSDRTVITSGTGQRGLPLIRLESMDNGTQRLTAEFARRRAGGSPGISYQFEFFSDVRNPGNSVSGTESVTPIDEIWERVKVIDSVSASNARFGRLRVSQP